AGAARVKIFACPSAPSRTLDYAPYFVSLGLPNLGPFVLGETDYAAMRGYHNNFRTACATNSPANASNGSSPGNDNGGLMGIKGQMTGGTLTLGKLTFASASDGLSNTIVMAEDAGRHQVYANRTPVTPNAPGQAGWALNAAAADYNTAILIRGFDGTGTVRD